MDSQGKKNLLFVFIIALLLYGIVSAVFDGDVEAQTTCENTMVKGVLRNLIYNYLSYGETFEGTNVTLAKIKGLLTLYKASSQLTTFPCLNYIPFVTEAGNLSLRPPQCSDSTYFGECSSTKPMYCYGYLGNLVPRCRLCGCPEGQWCDETYVDTTKGNEGQWGKCYQLLCSVDSDCGISDYTGGYYCKEGNVYRDYTKYSCLNAGTGNTSCSIDSSPKLIDNCQTGEECVDGLNECKIVMPPENITCSDGTSNYECSATKPKYCENGVLIDKCSFCGCEGVGCGGITKCQSDDSCRDVQNAIFSTNVNLQNLGDIEHDGNNVWIGQHTRGGNVYRLNPVNGEVLSSYPCPDFQVYYSYQVIAGYKQVRRYQYCPDNPPLYINYHKDVCYWYTDYVPIYETRQEPENGVAGLSYDKNKNELYYASQSHIGGYGTLLKMNVSTWQEIPGYRFRVLPGSTNDMVFDGGFIWVSALVTNGVDRVYKYTQDGISLGSFEVSLSNISNIVGMTWDGSNIWITIGNNLYKINQDRAFTDGTVENNVLIGTEVVQGGKIAWESPSYIWSATYDATLGQTKVYKLDISNCTNVCSDGTPFKQCAFNKPRYCNYGILRDNCQICGCEKGYKCANDGQCVKGQAY